MARLLWGGTVGALARTSIAILLAPAVAAALTATPTPTFPPTSSAPPCAGDCNGSATVVVAEIVSCVSIALDRAPVANCSACDLNGDGRVTISELLIAVRAALGGCGDRYEPDDAPELAKPIQCGASQRRALQPAGDEDWISLSVEGFVGVTISTFGDRGGDPTMELFEARSLRSIEYNDDFSGLFPSIRRRCGVNALEAGDYLVRMRGLGGTSVDDYTIELTCVPCSIPNIGPDEFEPDDTPAQASAVPCGAFQSRTSSYDDADWITITPTELSAVHIVTSGVVDPFESAYIELYDPAIPFGRFPIESGYGSLARDCGHDALEARTYDVRLQLSSDELSPYSMAVICEPCDVPNPTSTPTATATARPTPIPPDAAEPDNTREQASPLSCGQGVIRSLAPPGDSDWFVLDLPDRSAVSLVSNSYAAELALQNASGIDIDYSSWYSGAIHRTCGSNALEAGRYFIEVHSTNFSFPSAYDLVVFCYPCQAPNAPTFAPPTRTPTPPPLPADRYEPDDDWGEALEIDCGSLQSRSMHHRFDQDWVSFTLSRDTAISFSAREYLSLALYDSRLNDVADGYGVIGTTCEQPLPAGTYYAAVACSGCVPQAYNLSLSCGPCNGVGALKVPASPPPTPTPTPVM